MDLNMKESYEIMLAMEEVYITMQMEINILETERMINFMGRGFIFLQMVNDMRVMCFKGLSMVPEYISMQMEIFLKENEFLRRRMLIKYMLKTPSKTTSEK